jgi:hypothetical protein
MRPTLRRNGSRRGVPNWAVLCIVSVALINISGCGNAFRATAASIPQNEGDESMFHDALVADSKHSGTSTKARSLFSTRAASLDSIVTAERETAAASRIADSEEDEDGSVELQGSSYDNLKRLIGDLETCHDDLIKFGTATQGEANDQVTVSKSRWRSCREALFTAIRLLSERRDGKPKPHCAVVAKAASSRRGRRRQHASRLDTGGSPERPVGGERDAIDVDIQRPRCEELVCRVDGLEEFCSAPITQQQPNIFSLCTMCHPRDEKLISLYCAGRPPPEGSVFLFLCGMLLTVSAAAGCLICIRRLRMRRRRLAKDQGKRSAGPSEKRALVAEHGWRKWFSQRHAWMKDVFYQYREEGGRSTDDLEDNAGRSVDSTTWTYTRDGGLDQLPKPNERPKSILKAGGSPDDYSCSGAQRIPVLPRARSSSVQVPPAMSTGSPAEPTSKESPQAESSGRNSRYATIHTTTPSRRGLVFRQASSRRFESSP